MAVVLLFISHPNNMSYKKVSDAIYEKYYMSYLENFFTNT